MNRSSEFARWTRMFSLLVCAIILGSLICTGQVMSKPTFEIRDLVDSTSAIKHILKDDAGRKFFVGDTVFFSAADLISVKAEKDSISPGSLLNMTWKPECADQWTRYTASRVGKRIAIIANGKVLATPRVLDAILRPQIMVAMPDRDLKTAEKMAAELSPVKQ